MLGRRWEMSRTLMKMLNKTALSFDLPPSLARPFVTYFLTSSQSTKETSI